MTERHGLTRKRATWAKESGSVGLACLRPSVSSPLPGLAG